MAYRRLAITALVTALALTTPACRFSRSDNDAKSSSSTTSTIDTFGDLSDTSLDEETTTSLDENATTTTGGPTTTRKATVTTKATTRPATTRPVVSSPHCTVSAGDTTVGSNWTVSVSSTFPNAEAVISLSWPGGSGSYSGITDSGGSWVKTQRVQPTMRGQKVGISVGVGGRSCSTSFNVS